SKQWAATIAGQSDGKVALRVLNSSVTGEKNWAAFMDGEPGIYFAGIQWLTSRDWEVRLKLDANGQPIPKIDKKTKEPIPDKFVSESIHLNLLGRRLGTKKRHVDLLMFDEVHKMQNRHSNT